MCLKSPLHSYTCSLDATPLALALPVLRHHSPGPLCKEAETDQAPVLAQAEQGQGLGGAYMLCGSRMEGSNLSALLIQS